MSTGIFLGLLSITLSGYIALKIPPHRRQHLDYWRTYHLIFQTFIHGLVLYAITSALHLYYTEHELIQKAFNDGEPLIKWISNYWEKYIFPLVVLTNKASTSDISAQTPFYIALAFTPIFAVVFSFLITFIHWGIHLHNEKKAIDDLSKNWFFLSIYFLTILSILSTSISKNDLLAVKDFSQLYQENFLLFFVILLKLLYLVFCLKEILSFKQEQESQTLIEKTSKSYRRLVKDQLYKTIKTHSGGPMEEVVIDLAKKYANENNEDWFNPLLITLKNRKVYVGLVKDIPTLKRDIRPSFRIIPLLTGYRTQEELHFEESNDYNILLNLVFYINTKGLDEEDKTIITVDQDGFTIIKDAYNPEIEHVVQIARPKEKKNKIEIEVNPKYILRLFETGIVVDYNEIMSMRLYDDVLAALFRDARQPPKKAQSKS